MSAAVSSSTATASQGPAMHRHTTIASSPLPLLHPFSHFKQQRPRSVPTSASEERSDDETLRPPSPSASAAGRYSPPLHEILMDQAGEPYSLERFANFLQAQFCYENLAFWLASRQYKFCAQALEQSVRQTSPEFNLHQSSLPFLTPAQTRLFSDLQGDMLVILETFILPDSPYELNLSDSIRSRLLKAVTVGDYNPQVLGDARNAVTDLMKSSSYPLFLESVSGRVSLSTSSSSSASMLSQDDSDRDHAPWRLRAKENLKLVSKALKMHGL